MRKAIYLLITVIFLFSLSACSTQKNEDGVPLGDEISTQDEKVIVTLSFKENPGIAAALLTVTYDTSCLILEDAEYLDQYRKGGTEPNINNVPLKLMWCDLADCTQTDFAKLTFKVLNGMGKTAANKIDIGYQTGDICNLSEEDVQLSVLCSCVYNEKG